MPRPAKHIILTGRNTCLDALNSGREIASVLLAQENQKDPVLDQIASIAHKQGIKIEHVTSDELFKLTDRSSHQGVAVFMTMLEPPTIKQIVDSKPNAFILLLNHIDYEQNLGAIMRTAWAGGVDAIVVGHNGVHEVTPVVAKVSMGAAAYVPLISLSLFQALSTLKDLAVPIVGLEVGMGNVYSETKLTGPLALLVGGEASGLTQPLIKYTDTLINIPMIGNIASLNVSVAAALVVFERLRQERLG